MSSLALTRATLGKPATAGPMTVAMLAESYLAKHASKLRSYKEVAASCTQTFFRSSVTCRSRTSIAATCIACSIQSRNAAPPASARKVFTELRAMFNWAVARGLIDHNPAAAMQEDDAGKPRERFLNEEEIAALWPALSTASRHQWRWRSSSRSLPGSALAKSAA